MNVSEEFIFRLVKKYQPIGIYELFKKEEVKVTYQYVVHLVNILEAKGLVITNKIFDGDKVKRVVQVIKGD